MATIELNVNNFITLCLNNNHILWCEQILALVESQDLVDHVVNEHFTPLEFEITPDEALSLEKTKPTTTYLQWCKSDRLLWE